MMSTESNLAGRVTAANAGELANESVRARLSRMGELEASLEGSRRALLALDLGGIEGGTREQVVLIREFEALRRRPAEEAGTLALHAHAPELEQELRRSAKRILEAARLQAALLSRARCKLRVLANMLAGPSVDYGRLLARKGAGPRALKWKSVGIESEIGMEAEI